MIRYFLARGDRGGSAVIMEGLPNVTCSNPPPSVQIATLYMKTYCTACKREGFIAPNGPRWPGTAVNGKPWALSGDINVCECNPPPVFHAVRNMKMTFTSEEISRMGAAYVPGQSPQPGRSDERVGATPQFDDRFVLCDANGRPLPQAAYAIVRESGLFEYGESDDHGRTHLLSSVALAEHIHIYLAG